MHQPISAFITDMFNQRSLIYELSKRDFQQQYQGSYLGVVWMFLHPLLFVTLLYLVFTLGFRAGTSGEMPFVLYLVSGIVCWFYFAENLNAVTDSIRSHAFLVQKLDFGLSVLPLVKILSTAVAHVFLLFFVVLLAWYHGFAPSVYNLQTGYYFFSMITLLLAIGWLTSSTSIFVSDVARLVSVAAQFGFWLTPIFWNIEMIPTRYHWLIKLNPVHYIVTGYRDSLIARVAFWERPAETLYFWVLTLVLLYTGISVFRRLRPHFAEVI